VKLNADPLYANHKPYQKTLVINVILALLVWTAWWLYTQPDSGGVLQQNWPITLTMTVGSLIAGATSEGGGAIAFPVFTKALHIDPQNAKVFSLAIQSIGMTAASLTIIMLRIRVAWRFILWASLGGLPGLCVGTLLIAQLLPAALVKMLFTAMIVSFALALLLLNTQKRRYSLYLPKLYGAEKGIILITGFIGGTMTGLVGSGIDIICFSVMVLFFRLTEKVSTPTSVILMAITAIAGFMLHYFVTDSFNTTVKMYWLAAIPVVVIGAPLGVYICSRMRNEHIAFILLFLIAIELLSSLLLIPLTTDIAIASLTVFLLFSFAYYQMSRSQKCRFYESEG